jgi:hypothetical protein
MTSNSVQSPTSLGQRFLLIEVQHNDMIPAAALHNFSDVGASLLRLITRPLLGGVG